MTLQRKLSPKCKDLGSSIGTTKFEKAMLDLVASINVMPYSIYDTLNLDSLQQIDVIIQLIDHYNAYPMRVLEDVLVHVNKLIFQIDFYVLDMKNDSTSKETPLLLGRPSIRTAQTNIDVHEVT